MIKRIIDATKYHIPKKKRKAFSNPVGMKPSLIKEAPLPNIERKMKSKPNNSYCKAFAAFVLLFLFSFLLLLRPFFFFFFSLFPSQWFHLLADKFSLVKIGLLRLCKCIP